MHLIYSCHNNDEVTDLNQGNALCYVGPCVGSFSLIKLNIQGTLSFFSTTSIIDTFPWIGDKSRYSTCPDAVIFNGLI